MKDLFRPRPGSPARAIYDAFKTESEKRNHADGLKWIENERQVVFEAAKKYADEHGLIVPTIDQVMIAEQSAEGSTDYGAKWAYGIVAFMKDK